MDQVDVREYLDVLDGPACLLVLDDDNPSQQPSTSANPPRTRWKVHYANQHLSKDMENEVVQQFHGYQSGEGWEIEIPDWKVKIKTLRNGRKLILTMTRKSSRGRRNGKEEVGSGKMNKVPSSPDLDLEESNTLQGIGKFTNDQNNFILPTPDNPNPYSTPLPTPPSPEYLTHNATILSHPWHLTPLGPVSTWTTLLKATVQNMMLCPYAVLVAWGPESIVIYNHLYIRHIGAKHPAILGFRFQDAWPEIWNHLRGPVNECMQGGVVHVKSQELFLMRANEIPQETYFTYSFVPIRDERNKVVGLHVPNFDNTTEIINVRRLGSLRDISVHIAYAKTVDDVCDRALKAMKLNARDLGFVLMYLTVESNEWETEEDGKGFIYGNDEDADEETSSPSLSSGKTDSGSRNQNNSKKTNGKIEDGVKRFRLGGSIGVKPDANEEALPKRFSSCSTGEIEEFTEEAAPPGSLIRYLRRAHASGVIVKIQDLQKTPLASCLLPNSFGDATQEAVVLPIRVSTEERLHGILVVGLNTRLPYNQDYEGYVHLVRGFCVKGLTTVKLHAEEMQRAHYLATLHRQQNAQLQTMLAQKKHELRSLELKFSIAFAAMPVGAWLAHPDGSIYYMNDAYLEISGMTPGSDLNAWKEKVHPDDDEMVTKLYQECMIHPVAAEFRFKAPDRAQDDKEADEVWVAASASPAFDDDGNIFMIYGTIMDISTRKAAELFQKRRAEDAMETKRQHEYFIDMTSHELRNPLSAICMAVDELSGSFKKLAGSLADQGSAVEFDQMMNNATTVRLCAMHMANLIDDVLALSKLESNLLVITSVPSNVIGIIEEVMQIYHNEILSKGIECILETSPAYQNCGTDCFDIDPARVKQVLINLLTNAIKFTYKSKNTVKKITFTLDLTTTRPQASAAPSQDSVECVADETLNSKCYLIFSVRDTGIGIADLDRVRLFERFKQGNVRTHVTYGGNGLGLYICKQITGLLGGDIWAESEVDVGSLFSFYVPSTKLSSPPEGTEMMRQKPNNFFEPMTGSRPVNPSTPIHVLLTEDNHINQTLLRRQLMSAGCIVAIANDGIEALEYVQASSAAVDQGHVLDCILMDIEMPRMGGIECTRRIRDLEKAGYLRRHVPIIAVSANTRAEQVKVMIDSGMDGAVAKPFKMEDIIDRMRTLVT